MAAAAAAVGLAQTEVIINARHARLFRDLCVEKSVESGPSCK